MPKKSGGSVARRQRDTYLPSLLIDKGVPRTNQSQVYKTGDDATYKAGVSSLTPRFIDNFDGTVTDTATNLMWVKDPSQIGGDWGTPGTPESMTWDDALQHCNNLCYAGYCDWRLPNIKELESLIDFSKSDPAIDDSKFPNTKNEGYWSGSMTYYGCDNEFFPNFGTGAISWEQDKNLKKYVRPVRQIPPGHKGGRRKRK